MSIYPPSTYLQWQITGSRSVRHDSRSPLSFIRLIKPNVQHLRLFALYRVANEKICFFSTALNSRNRPFPYRIIPEHNFQTWVSSPQKKTEAVSFGSNAPLAQGDGSVIFSAIQSAFCSTLKLGGPQRTTERFVLL